MKFLAIHIKISTHTPARGVTKKQADAEKKAVDFYSHAREGRDLLWLDAGIWSKDFYSHAREGRD